jgi:hypothetical protein
MVLDEIKRLNKNKDKVIEFYNKIPKKDYSTIITTNPFEAYELKEEVYETTKDPTIKIIKL